MNIWLARVLKLTIAALTAATLVAMVAADAWWIRVFDFPRLQFEILLAVATTFVLIPNARRHWQWGVVGGVALALQMYQLFPYSSLASTQAVSAVTCRTDDRLTLLSANVLQSNRAFDELLALVRKERPDVLLVMETDRKWIEALAALESAYPFRELRAQGNRYGMALYSRLPLDNLEVRDLTGEGTPAMRATVELRSGKKLTLFTVHPRPPHPGRGSGQRDAALILLATDVQRAGRPAVVIGDFNDVGWSSSMELFQKVGGVLDPRIGRGLFPSYSAKNPLMRWPLDYVFHTDDFGVLRFGTGPNIGSDHFPLLVTLCQSDTRFEQASSVPVADENDRDEAAEELRKGAGEDVRAEARRLDPKE